MFIEAGANTVNGMISFVGGMAGGITGLNAPGIKNGFGSYLKHHTALTYFGAYPTKFLVSHLRGTIQEKY
jgi:hypothetical protein